MNKILYNREIDDELMIQFIIMYTLSHADEPMPYADLLSTIQNNCEISFTDLQIGLDNLVQTGHVTQRRVTDMLSIYDITNKGRNVIDFFYPKIPLIIREPIDKSIKALYIEKRRREAVRAGIEPINQNEFNAECNLYNDDKSLIMSLTLYAGSRDDAEHIAEYFKANSAKVYGAILELFNEEERK